MEFIVEGDNLDLLLQEDIIALYSNINSDPTMNIEEPKDVVTGFPIQRSDKSIVFSTRDYFHNYNYGTPHYLGAIINRTTKEIYWINESQPLP